MKSYKEPETLSSLEAILSAALDLPPELRARLAGQLLESLDNAEQVGIDAAWSEEVDRRIRDIDERRVQLIPGEEVLAELRSRFK